jgi:mRNA-capping enzyme
MITKKSRSTWINVPKMGEALGLLIPMKSPMDVKQENELQIQNKFTPELACEYALKRSFIDPTTNLKEKFRGVGIVIDLTAGKSSYDPENFGKFGVLYDKIPCLGHSTPPSQLEVNTSIYKIRRIYKECLKKRLSVLIHCTHGFNRSGFIIVLYWLRMQDNVPLHPLSDWINLFATSRPPGINKNSYINELFARSCESRISSIKTVPITSWTVITKNNQNPHKINIRLQNSVKTQAPYVSEFEKICSEEEISIRRKVIACILGDKKLLFNKTLFFPGSHPVSLIREKLASIIHLDYMLTWKSDGTRYIMLIEFGNVYLINRKMDVVSRTSIRFLDNVSTVNQSSNPKFKIGGLLPLTILDGEMIVDENSKTNGLKFLIFDLMCYKGSVVTKMHFRHRHTRIKAIITTRKIEMILNNQRKFNYKYEYNKELFGIRRKHFYELNSTREIIERLIPKLYHKSDGLIFQGGKDPYFTGTCNNLFKWKPSDRNSVDLLFKAMSKKKYCVCVSRFGSLYPIKEKIYISNKENRTILSMYDLENCVIECNFDNFDNKLIFMKIRGDKNKPNEITVYQKVLKSIEDVITSLELLKTLDSYSSSLK